MAFVDERSRLVIAQGSVQMWRSLTPVGGGAGQGSPARGRRSTPTSTSSSTSSRTPWRWTSTATGIDEIVVPVNQDEAGRMAVVFKGPAGFRMQVVNSGFEGMVTGLGAIANDGGYPAPARHRGQAHGTR